MEASARRPEVWPGLAVFGILLAVYAASAAPNVGHGHDTGELTAAAVTLGIPHPPGYPLYTHLGHLWYLLVPIGNPAYRLNLFSAFCMAVAGGLLAAAVTRSTRQPLTGWVTALLFGFATATWRQAVVAEVFALHLTLLAGLVYLAVRWSEATDAGRFRLTDLAGLLVGLGLAHHHTLILAVPCLLLYGALTRGSGRVWGFRWSLLPMFLLGAVPFYLDMRLRAQQHPNLNWGDPSTWGRLKDHFLRRAYGTFRLSRSEGAPGSVEANIKGYVISLLRHQLPVPLIFLAIPGLVAAVRRQPLAVLFLALALAYGPLFALLGNQAPDDFHLDMQERFYVSSVLGWAGLAGLGAGWLTQIRPRLLPVLWLVPLVSLGLNWSRCSLAGQSQGYDTVRQMLANLPRSAILVMGGDLPAGVATYLQKVEGFRTDVTVVFPGLVGVGWFQDGELTWRMRAAARGARGHDACLAAVCQGHHRDGFAVYFNLTDAKLPGSWIPRGLVWEWRPPDSPGPQPTLADLRRELRLLLSAECRGESGLRASQPFWTRYFLAVWAQGYRELARRLFREDPAAALLAMERIVELAPPTVMDRLNCGLLLSELGRFPQARVQYLEALRLHPDHPLVLASLVDLSRTQGQEDQAREWLERLNRVRAPGPRPSPGPSPAS